MTIVINRSRVRDAILSLHRNGDILAAEQIWDLYDAYHELETELVTQAGQSPAVKEIEELLSAEARTYRDQVTASPHLRERAADLIARCHSYYLTEDQGLVRCQGFVNHGGLHSSETLDGDDTYLWPDDDAYERPATPAQRTSTEDEQPRKDPAGYTIFPGQATVDDYLVTDTGCSECQTRQRVTRDWAAACSDHSDPDA